MNQSSLYGLLGGGLLLVVLIVISPEQVGTFINFPGLVIVVGGTLAATLVSRPLPDIQRLLKRLPLLLNDEQSTLAHDIDQLLRFTRLYRTSSLKVTEQALDYVDSPFLQSGLSKIVERMPRPELIKDLNWQISSWHDREQEQAHILYHMAVFAPAFGMLGTLFGLVPMLSGLGSQGLTVLGPMMAFAMMTTVYGIVAANLLFKPLAMKLERRTHKQLMHYKILVEGMLDVQERRHPELIEEKLATLTREPARDNSTASHLALVKN